MNQQHLADVELNEAAEGNGDEGERSDVGRHAQRVAKEQSLMCLLVGKTKDMRGQHNNKSHQLNEQHADEEHKEHQSPVAHSAGVAATQRPPVATRRLHQVFHEYVVKRQREQDDDKAVNEERHDGGRQMTENELLADGVEHKHGCNEQAERNEQDQRSQEYAFQRAPHEMRTG